MSQKSLSSKAPSLVSLRSAKFIASLMAAVLFVSSQAFAQVKALEKTKETAAKVEDQAAKTEKEVTKATEEEPIDDEMSVGDDELDMPDDLEGDDSIDGEIMDDSDAPGSDDVIAK